MKSLLPCGLRSRSTPLLASLIFSDNTNTKDALSSSTKQKNPYDKDQEEEQNGWTVSKHVETHRYHRLDIFSTSTSICQNVIITD